MKEVRRGQIYLVDLGDGDGTCKQAGIRPAIVVSNDMANRNSTVIHIVPLTTKKTTKKLPTHLELEIGGNTGLFAPSIAMAEQSTLVDKGNLIKKIGKVSETFMNKIEVCLLIQFGVYEKTRNLIEENNFYRSKYYKARC